MSSPSTPVPWPVAWWIVMGHDVRLLWLAAQGRGGDYELSIDSDFTFASTSTSRSHSVSGSVNAALPAQANASTLPQANANTLTQASANLGAANAAAQSLAR